MDCGDDQAMLDFVLNQLIDPDAFLKKVRTLYASDAVDMDTIAFKDGRVLERYSLPMILDGVRIGRVWSFRDITKLKKAEAEKAKLEEQNRQLQKAESLDRMAAAISHHFNNQLHVVLGYLGMVINDLPTDDFRVEKLTRAQQAANKAAEVSGLLLSYLGQIPGKLESLDLSEICRLSLPILQAGKPRRVALETDLPSNGPCINADSKQIQHLLTNLVINAWEAIGDGIGTISLNVRMVPHTDIPEAHRFPVEWHPVEQDYACLEVRDSGCGIDEKEMDNIFDPFFSTKFTGRGLGLSVVLGIVKAHESGITVERGIDGGCVFKVFFSQSATVMPRKDEKYAEALQTAHGGTVLLVEDEESLRKMTEIALVDMGFKVFQAKNGVEAVDIFKKRNDEISCLLCDLTMPRMGGWETISALRAIRHDLPVVLSSGYDEATVMAGEHAELPDYFLNKPYNLDKLGDTIGRAIARRK
jgi:signal transduction histidine kinase/CheY-like chemotaxis protein